MLSINTGHGGDFLAESLRSLRAEHRIPEDIRSTSNRDILVLASCPVDTCFIDVEPVEATDEHQDDVGNQKRWDVGQAALGRETAICILTNPGRGNNIGVNSQIPGLGMSCLTHNLFRSMTLDEPPSPIWVMASRSFDEVSAADIIVNTSGFMLDITVFSGSESYALDPMNCLAFNENGSPMTYPTGTGDLGYALHREGMLQNFIDSGGKYVMVTELHNGTGGIHASVLGHHINSGNDITCEVTRRLDNEAGPGPVIADGRLRILDDPCATQIFTGNMIINADVLMDSLKRRMDFCRTPRNRGGRILIQHERSLTQLADWYDTGILRVSRERFMPLGALSDLNDLSRKLECRFGNLSK